MSGTETGAATTAKLTIDDPVLFDFADEVGVDDPVAVEGGRTRWDLGGALDDGTRLVRAPSGIVEYVPDEMIVRVRAGTTVAELHRELAAHGQRSSLPERSALSTVGGAVVVGENHLASLGRGRLRADVLQVRYVSAEGKLVSGGGPTVKNVTGFDIPRLMTGSLGTLGLVAEVILRTNPVPAVSRWLRGESCDPFAARDALLAPSAVLWNGSTTWILLEGHGPDVDSEQRALGSIGSFADVDGPPSLPEHRWSLATSDLQSLTDHRSEDTGTFVASVGTGLVFAEQPQPVRALGPAVTEITARMASLFDPTNRLNPGRGFPSGTD